MKQRIYIAGKVTGEDRLECALKFETAKNELSAMGFEPVNPLEVVGTWDITWEEAMKKCLKALMDCHAIYMLPCCANSKGAKLEIKNALELKIPIIISKKWKNNSQHTQ